MADFIRVDLSGTPEATLRALGRQMPFALSVAMNRTVEDANAAVRRRMQSTFVLRRPGFDLPPQQLPSIARATKSRLHAEVRLAYADVTPGSVGDRREVIFRKHEEGLIKRADDPSFPIAIPTTAIRPSFPALVPLQFYPKNLRLAPRQQPDNTTLPALRRGKVVTLAGAKISNRARKQQGLTGTLGTFTISNEDGRPKFIAQRTGSGRRELRIIWLLKQQIRIKPLRFFYPTIAPVISERFPVNVAGAIDLALRTAL
jgi:hypothetical protein